MERKSKKVKIEKKVLEYCKQEDLSFAIDSYGDSVDLKPSVKRPRRKQYSRSNRVCKQKNEFLCDSCDKQFSCFSKLMSHSRVHSGEKPYACRQCGKFFSQSNTLKVHIRIVHGGEKLFICPVCQKRFARKNHLNRHLVLHDGEKPYSCVECEKAFTDKFKLTLHEKVHAKKSSSGTD